MHQPPVPKRPQDHKLKVIPRDLAKQPAPRPLVELQYRVYQDTPGFGFEIVRINGVAVYLACNFTPDGKIVRPQNNVPCFFSDAEADAFKEKLKEDAQKPQLILPGDPRYVKPR